MKNYHFTKKGGISFFLFLIVQLALGQTTKVIGILERFNNQPEHILVAAHRAEHTDFPENSIAAIEASIQHDIDIIEIDIRQTKDGKLILMHDSTVDRTTTGTGNISKYTWEELQKLYLLHNGEPTGERIPLLEDVFQTIKGKIMVDLDFKLDKVKAVRQTYNLIHKYSLEDQVLFFLYDYRYIPRLQKLNPMIKIMPRAHNVSDIQKILAYDIDIIHIDDSFYSDELMKNVRDKGIRLWSNALGKYDKMEKESIESGFNKLLKMKYINVIQTDLPVELLTYLKKKNKHF